MLAGRKYRLTCTAEQAEYAETIGSICRSVWNTALEQRQMYLRRHASISYYEQAGQLVAAKAEFAWLKTAPSHVLQQALMDLDRACREHGTARVHWRSGRRWNPSFRFPDPTRIAVERLGRRWGRVKLPKLGWIRFRWCRPLGGTIRSATMSRAGRHWFISFLIDDGETTPDQHISDSAVGVDRGVATAVATSDGALLNREFRTRGEKHRYVRLQRRLARQRKDSVNRRRTVAVMRVLSQRERDRRRDFCAWNAHQLATQHGLVVLENLRTRNMTASARGTANAPGTHVRQKAGLNRSIMEKGWHMLVSALHNVARHTGAEIRTVKPAYTSQTCFVCKHVDRESRESQAVFRCTACGHEDHADVNAAKNILAAGLAVTACGDLGTGRSVKQEPSESP
jgi:putative transposase